MRRIFDALPTPPICPRSAHSDCGEVVGPSAAWPSRSGCNERRCARARAVTTVGAWSARAAVKSGTRSRSRRCCAATMSRSAATARVACETSGWGRCDAHPRERCDRVLRKGRVWCAALRRPLRVRFPRRSKRVRPDCEPTGAPRDERRRLLHHLGGHRAWHQRLTTAALPVSQVEDMPWGMHEFTLTDPSGNRVRIGRPTGDGG